MSGAPNPTSIELARWVRDARARTLQLLADLSDEQLIGPQLETVNPLLWELGHVAWFQEHWVLRHVAGREPLRADAERLYDSIQIPHHARWSLALPSRVETLAYAAAVRDAVLALLEEGEPSPALAYFTRYTVFHEDMHAEAFTYTRQTLAYPAPGGERPRAVAPELGRAEGDARFEGGVFALGAARSSPFVFDNEKWEHPLEVEPFAMARAATTQEAFRAFVDDGGYARRELWCEAGWQWRARGRAEAPVYWRRGAGGWERRVYDRWVALEAELPVAHVNWYEAGAYCRWAGRRLPTEPEWELAATGGLHGDRKPRFPWGGAEPTPERARLEWAGGGPTSVHAHAAGDGPGGCRQLIGNVWEWTATDFAPYPGFERDAYEEYSAPWFHTRKVLRGGCWATRSRMLRNTWRNYYEPERRDVLAGFRTCAL